MARFSRTLLALATLSATATAAALAQNAYSGPGTPDVTQSQAAPIERSAPQGGSFADGDGSAPGNSDNQMAYSGSQASYSGSEPAYDPGTNGGYAADNQGGYGSSQGQPNVSTSQPVQGVWLRSAQGASVQTVSANNGGTELRVEHGVVNVTVRHPAENAQILVDLPGGQTALMKDGLYTFNADTNTIRVLQGEAAAFSAGRGNGEVKVKEDHQFSFVPGSNHATEVSYNELRADLLPGPGPGYGGGRGYGAGFYGDGPYYGSGYAYGPYGGYPYGGYYGYGYPYYAYGYPFGFGLGFGYYGGFRGGYGGYRGFGGYGGLHGGYGGFGGGGFRGGGGRR